MTLIVLGLMCLVGVVLELVLDVREGRGLDYFFNGFGIRMNAIGVLVVVGLIPVALLGGRLLHWWIARDERDFERRYPPPDGPGDS